MFDIPEKGVKSSKHIQVTIKPLSLGYTANDTVRNTWEKMKSNPPPLKHLLQTRHHKLRAFAL